jgi:hypothetical protein
MTDNQLLVVILGLIYFSECICWIGGTSYAFQFSTLGKGSVNRPGGGLGNAHGRLLLSRLWPFRAGLFVVPGSATNFDLAAAKERWERFRERTRWLGRGAMLSFLLLFGLVPAVWNLSGAESWQMLASAVLLLLVNLTTAVIYFRLHLSYHPGQSWDRWQHALLIGLVPTHTPRARDTLGRSLLQEYHPLTIAALALPQPRFRRLAETCLREATFPLPGHAQPPNLSEIMEFLQTRGVTLSLPVPADDATHYCPRCRAQFGAVASVCEDCQGLPLLPFDRAH